MYLEDWPLPAVRDSGDVGVLCTFTNIPVAAAADIPRSSQLSSSLSGQAVRHVMAGGSAVQHSTNQVPSTLFSAGRRAGSFLCGLRTSLVRPLLVDVRIIYWVLNNESNRDVNRPLCKGMLSPLAHCKNAINNILLLQCKEAGQGL
jgi:hypothetical protein